MNNKDKLKESICDFILNEFKSMKENLKSNYSQNLENRTNNVFHCFTNNDIEKYMTLSRSFDSQLGNRLQRIIMYSARLRYGKTNVPNYFFIKPDFKNNTVLTWKYSYEDIMDIRHDSNGMDVYKTQQTVLVNDEKECVDFIVNEYDSYIKEKLKLNCNFQNFRSKKSKEALDDEIIKCRQNILNSLVKHEYKCDKDRLKNIGSGWKPIPVDLLYFENDNSVSVFEIKAGGKLDTKNCQSNAKEVLDNLKRLSFIDDHNSYFAACYNNRKGDIEGAPINNNGVLYRGEKPNGSIFDIFNKRPYSDMSGRILVGSVFWEKIIPQEISFVEFLGMYKEQFEKSKLEEGLKDL